MNKKNKTLIIVFLIIIVIGAAVAAVFFFKPSEPVSAIERIKKELAAEGIEVSQVAIEKNTATISYTQPISFKQPELYANWTYIMGTAAKNTVAENIVIMCNFEDGEVLQIEVRTEDIELFIKEEITDEEFLSRITIKPLTQGPALEESDVGESEESLWQEIEEKFLTVVNIEKGVGRKIEKGLPLNEALVEANSDARVKLILANIPVVAVFDWTGDSLYCLGKVLKGEVGDALINFSNMALVEDSTQRNLAEGYLKMWEENKEKWEKTENFKSGVNSLAVSGYTLGVLGTKITRIPIDFIASRLAELNIFTSYFTILQISYALLALLFWVILGFFVRLITFRRAKEEKPVGFWARFIALGFDFSLLYILTGLLCYWGAYRASFWLVIILVVSYFFFFWLYQGATPGKWLIGAKIISLKGATRLKVGQVILRLLGCIFLSFGWLAIIFNRQKRILHDYFAGTRVAYSRRRPEEFRTKKARIAVNLLLVVTLILFFSFLYLGLGEKITDYGETDKVKLVDFNQDGLTDMVMVDTDGDNKFELLKADINRDKIVDFTGHDIDGDGKADALDINNDGKIDGYDWDGDNVIDQKVWKGYFWIVAFRAWLGLLGAIILFLFIFSLVWEGGAREIAKPEISPAEK